jgi:hypothetical protein
MYECVCVYIYNFFIVSQQAEGLHKRYLYKSKIIRDFNKSKVLIFCLCSAIFFQNLSVYR